MALPKLRAVSTKVKSRRKILLLSDDIMTTSGIASQSKMIIYNTVNDFNWVQLASAVTHPEQGKVFDVSQQVGNETNTTDVSVKLYPNSGYGDPNRLRELIEREKPDAILHFTDPRFWGWLYQMEDEIHQKYKIPIMYYAIWDNLPYPLWNIGPYSACDLIMGISKQSHLIHNKVLEYGEVATHDITKSNGGIIDDYKPGDVITSYVPHGIDGRIYHPITAESPQIEPYEKFKKAFLEANGNPNFILYWTNRNIRRKNPSDVILAFKKFTESLPKDQSSKCMLLMHTNPVDNNGTDLLEVRRVIAPKCNIVFSTNKIPIHEMNWFYNLADVTINVASNEGFGLSSAESIMAGTPVINNVTGGLQDQMRFVDKKGKWFTPSDKITSNHTATYTECGEWAIPIFPSNISMQGSVATPYIFDDRADVNDITAAITTAYVNKNQLETMGLKGREWLLSNESNMSAESLGKNMVKCINSCLDNWKPKPKYEVFKIKETKKVLETGVMV